MTARVSVIPVSESIFAKPKSNTFTPWRVTMILDGFKSRCTIPSAWASARAPAICAP